MAHHLIKIIKQCELRINNIAYQPEPEAQTLGITFIAKGKSTRVILVPLFTKDDFEKLIEIKNNQEKEMPLTEYIKNNTPKE